MAPQISPEKSSKIVISPDDEQCIKKGNMTKDQEKALMSKILAQIETQKVKDTQQESPANISLQPISDEEIEGEFSEEEEEEEKKAPKVPEVSPAVHGDVPTAHSDVPAAHGDLPQADTSAAHGDKDERVPPLHSSGQTGDYQKQSYYGGRRQHSGWRGRRGKHYEGPHARGGGRQGARPEGKHENLWCHKIYENNTLVVDRNRKIGTSAVFGLLKFYLIYTCRVWHEVMLI